MLLFWPLYVVLVGLSIGYAVAKLTKTPPSQVRSVLAACGFANSTGLPITLLTVVDTIFPATSDLGRIDPTLFLSVYLLLYPVLQWGLGGWLLAPSKEPATLSIANHRRTPSVTDSLRHNVLNNQERSSFYKKRRGTLNSADEGLYVTELDLTQLLAQEEEKERLNDSILTDDSKNNNNYNTLDYTSNSERASTPKGPLPTIPSETAPLVRLDQSSEYDTENLWQTIANILDRCFQPPVIGALLGIVCAVTPVRGILVDIVDRDASAPLQWLFDGLYAVGQAAVPINMMILGSNLSASHQLQQKTASNHPRGSSLLTPETMTGIVIGKMLAMPFVGILTAYILKAYIWDIPDDIDASFYLVLMIVFLTPTANNVIVMVELSGSDAKEGIARVIALQYLVAPILLSLTMTIAIGVASDWT